MKDTSQLQNLNVFGNKYLDLLFHPKSKAMAQQRLLIGVPMTGLVRSEWALSRYGQIIPTNWAHQDMLQYLNQSSPLGFAVAEGRNLIIDRLVNGPWEWLLFIDHDVILPPDAFVRINLYITKKKYPVVSGVYFAKAEPPEPLIYKGRGNGAFRDWEKGDLVWADGIPFGCCLIHRSLLEVMHKDAPAYTVSSGQTIKKVIDTPSGMYFDPQQGFQGFSGTEDLAWCNRVIAGDYLAKAGWKEIAKKKYPFLVDTNIFCLHMTQEGVAYPRNWASLPVESNGHKPRRRKK